MLRNEASGTLSLESSRAADQVCVKAVWKCCGRRSDDALGRFFVERYAHYNPTGRLLRCILGDGASLWHGLITHEPWPLHDAKLTSFEGDSLLAALGLSTLVRGPTVAHASRGVGPINFFWGGELLCAGDAGLVRMGS